MNGKKWIIASIIVLGALLLGGVSYFLLVTFYHPLTLIHSVDRTNVIGYFEWRKQDEEQLFKSTNVPLPEILATLGCKQTDCSYSGNNSALVLRNDNDGAIWELYIDHPNNSFQANWDLQTHGKNELLIDQSRYHLIRETDLAIITPRSENEVDHKSMPIDSMPWIKDGSWSTWSQNLGVGYCNEDCLWTLWGNIGNSFPLMADFLKDTISYSTFTIKNSDTGPTLNYFLNYSASYHGSTVNTSLSSFTILQEAKTFFSGQNLSQLIKDLFSDGQNQGLWQTTIDFGSQNATGKSLQALQSVVGEYPYTISLGDKWQNTVVQLHAQDNEWSHIKDTITNQAHSSIPMLFPSKQSLVMPDGSIGYEWVKNTAVNYIWSEQTSDQSLFTISDKRSGNNIIQIFANHKNNLVTLSLQPINSSSSICQAPNESKEFSGWYFDKQGQWLWEYVTKQSIGSVQGIIGWSSTIPNCVQN